MFKPKNIKKAGDIISIGDGIYKILFIDDKGALVENINGIRKHLGSKTFDGYTVIISDVWVRVMYKIVCCDFFEVSQQTYTSEEVARNAESGPSYPLLAGVVKFENYQQRTV